MLIPLCAYIIKPHICCLFCWLLHNVCLLCTLSCFNKSKSLMYYVLDLPPSSNKYYFRAMVKLQRKLRLQLFQLSPHFNSWYGSLYHQRQRVIEFKTLIQCHCYWGEWRLAVSPLHNSLFN